MITYRRLFAPRDGLLVALTLFPDLQSAPAASPCRIWTDLTNPATDDKKFKNTEPGLYDLDLAKGETALIYEKAKN